MKNIETKVTGNKLVITVDLKKTFGTSKSKKSIIIATTEGNARVDDTDGVVMGLNVYRKVEGKEE